MDTRIENNFNEHLCKTLAYPDFARRIYLINKSEKLSYKLSCKRIGSEIILYSEENNDIFIYGIDNIHIYLKNIGVSKKTRFYQESRF